MGASSILDNTGGGTVETVRADFDGWDRLWSPPAIVFKKGLLDVQMLAPKTTDVLGLNAINLTASDRQGNHSAWSGKHPPYSLRRSQRVVSKYQT